MRAVPPAKGSSPYRPHAETLMRCYASDHMLNANKKCGEELRTAARAGEAACRPGSLHNGAINHSILPLQCPEHIHHAAAL
jgi:hypothetical protein